MSRMFPFITKTVNPIGGDCPHDCRGCWAKGFADRLNMKKYKGGTLLYREVLQQRFSEKDFVFVQDMSDLFANCVPSRYILEVIDWINSQPKTKFLLLTKNPERYLRFCKDHEFRRNVILGATVETNHYRFDAGGTWIEYEELSLAPAPKGRLKVMQRIKATYGYPVFISVEPILDFGDKETPSILSPSFATAIRLCTPFGVAVGYDNYNNKLPEPKLEKTLKLIDKLESYGIKVYRKTLREAWYEK